MKISRLREKKELLDSYRPLPAVLVKNLEDWFRVELTYTSNAIEGNTLTRRETALVVEKGLTVGGKTLVEHLEATNHAHALDWVRQQASRSARQLTEKDVLSIHEIILKGIDSPNAGFYRSVPVRISGSTVVLPNPRKVPDLMEAFVTWLQQGPDLHPVELAAEAHYRLVTIHPFADGNGRTARLLMNLILLMTGYPTAIIRKLDREAYLALWKKPSLVDPKTITCNSSIKPLTARWTSIFGLLGAKMPKAKSTTPCSRSANWPNARERTIRPSVIGRKKACLKSRKLRKAVINCILLK